MITTRHHGRYFDYDRILKFTRSRHRFVLHIVLDDFQHSLQLTFPATLSSDTIIETIDRFIDVAQNTCSIAPLARRATPPKS
jgi:hypothetical protein